MMARPRKATRVTTPKKVVRRRYPKKRKRSKLEDRFAAICEYQGWPPPERELRFHEAGVLYQKRRLFRFDFAWPEYRVAVELDGGVWKPSSGHRSPSGITADHEKDFIAQYMGWFVIRINEISFREGHTELWVEEALKLRGWERSEHDEPVDATDE